MRNKPKVTIITPTYNHQDFISECIESVMNQTYQNWEHIIVDDGSTDQTATIIEGYLLQDDRIKFIEQPHKGINRLSETYNTAFVKAQGDLIAILEGDDYWPTDKLKKQCPLHKEGVILSYGSAVVIDESKSIRRNYRKPPFTGYVSNIAFQNYMLRKQSKIQPVTVICDADALRNLGGFIQDEGYPAVDFSTFLRLTQFSGLFAYDPHVLGFWRSHSGQTTGQLDSSTRLIEGRLNISLAWYHALDADVQGQLDLTKKTIIRAHASSLADRYLNLLRDALIRRDHDVFWQRLPLLWRYGNLRRKALAIYALFAYSLGMDMEWILKTYMSTKDHRKKQH